MGEEEIYRVFEKRWLRLCRREDAEIHWKELMNAASSVQSDWQEVFEENRPLRAELRKLQGVYGLPLASYDQVLEWIERNFKEYTQFTSQLDLILERFGISRKWRNTIYQRITRDSPSIGPRFRLGFASSRLQNDAKDGEFELVLTPEVNLQNPFIQEDILFRKVLNNPPPRPRLVIGDEEQRMDWGPVWEWYEHHPQLAIAEIAELLNYPFNYVRRKFKEHARQG